MIFWHIDTSQGQASVELSSVLSFRHFVQCSDQLMTAPSHDGQVSVATTGPKAIFFFQTQAISAFVPLQLNYYIVVLFLREEVHGIYDDLVCTEITSV